MGLRSHPDPLLSEREPLTANTPEAIKEGCSDGKVCRGGGRCDGGGGEVLVWNV